MANSKVVLYVEECRFGFIVPKRSVLCCIQLWQDPYKARSRCYGLLIFKAVHKRQKHVARNRLGSPGQMKITSSDLSNLQVRVWIRNIWLIFQLSCNRNILCNIRNMSLERSVPIPTNSAHLLIICLTCTIILSTPLRSLHTRSSVPSSFHCSCVFYSLSWMRALCTALLILLDFISLMRLVQMHVTKVLPWSAFTLTVYYVRGPQSEFVPRNERSRDAYEPSNITQRIQLLSRLDL
jgi:hypothetical protein